MRQHDFHAIVGRQYCRFCGARRADGMTATCIDRPAPDMPAPEPKRRVPVCEDADSIGARLAELARERAAALSPAPDPAAAAADLVPLGDDGCCGD